MSVILFALVLNLLVHKRTALKEELNQVQEIEQDSTQINEPVKNGKVVVVDPGHGGMDPGKVGINNALEKDINLSIALKLKSILEENGFDVVMTRDADVGLYPEGSSNKKRDDLDARVNLINSLQPDFVISVHQNSYPQQSCKGAQVFYYQGSNEGEALAACIQEAVKTYLDSTNKREIKANDKYYLLRKTSVPTVIVECGFLSNPTEADNLLVESYQEKVAQAIYEGILMYIEK